MTRHRSISGTFLLLAVLAFAASCRTEPDAEPVTASEPAEALHDVMKAKLVHSNALLDAITYEDFDRIAQEASALTWLSERSEWLVHETVAYVAFSDEFRTVTERIADRARAHDSDGVGIAYAEMTGVCMRCHNYLRRERLYRDMPGRVSMR
jgi:cytochrome c556